MSFSAREGRRFNPFHPDYELFQIPTFHISVDQSGSQSHSLSDQGFQTSCSVPTSSSSPNAIQFNQFSINVKYNAIQERSIVINPQFLPLHYPNYQTGKTSWLPKLIRAAFGLSVFYNDVSGNRKPFFKHG